MKPCFHYKSIVQIGYFSLFGLLSTGLGFSQYDSDPATKLAEFLLTGMSKRSPEGGEAKNLSPEELKQLIQKPGFQKNILRWKVLDSISPEKIKELSRTSFMRAFLNNLEWQQAFFGSGPNPYPDLAISNLALLCKRDPQTLTNPVYRKLATATALEFSRNRGKEKNPSDDGPWSDKKMIERYNYFRSSHSAGLLNPSFDKLDYWDMRILTGCTHAGFGADASLKWQRDNVRLPAQNYTGACWQAPYRLFNEWGESIHGADYYRPFDGLFTGATAEMTREVGAVCGGLSHFGAYAAIANGIPALPMGEPGHCAYTVRVDGKTWVPAYSLSTERGCHWMFYGNNWSDLILMQDMFSRKPACPLSFLASWAGQMAQKSGDTATALLLYEGALQILPQNYPVWLEYLDLVQKSNRVSKGKWKQISKHVMNAFSKNYPEISWNILEKQVYPHLMDLLTTTAEKVKEIDTFNKSLDKMLPIPWKFSKSLDSQHSFLSSAEKSTNNMLDIIVSSHLNSDDYGAPSMTWFLNLVESDPELLDRFVSKVVGHQGGVKGSTMASLASEMIRLSGKSGDIATFKTVGKLMAKEFKQVLPKYDPFPGELLSSGGMVQLSSFATQYCEPWRLWGVIEACGGRFHTENDDPAVATVILPRIGDINGIVILGEYGQNAHRCNGMVIESSLDGTKWSKLGDISKMQNINRIDLASKPVRAKLVRITRPGKNYFHLQGIHIYGKKAS